MSDPAEAISHYSTELDLSWLHEPYPHPVQPGLLVSADRDIVTGDIPGLVEKYAAVAADWESGAIAWVAKKNGVRCLILRGVTDLVSAVGRRSLWQHPDLPRKYQGGDETTDRATAGLVEQDSSRDHPHAAPFSAKWTASGCTWRTWKAAWPFIGTGWDTH